MPRPSSRPARPTTWCSSWNVRSAARGSPLAEPEIGVDDADQVELREMVALGHELRADDDVEAALRDVVELLAQALDRFDEVARQHQDARVGKQLGRLLLQPLDAGPDRRERDPTAWHFGHLSGSGMAKPQ